MRTIAQADAFQARQLERAISFSRLAREAAKRAKSPQATKALRRALKSLDGARRHMSHRLMRTS